MPKPLIIERATSEDAAALAALHATSFARGWTRDEFTSMLSDKNIITFVLRKKPFSAPLAFNMARIAADEAEILSIVVAKAFRGKGEGRRLMHAIHSPLMQRGAKQLFLEVESENRTAIKLYTRFGFTQVGKRKGYYEGKDALIMRKLL